MLVTMMDLSEVRPYDKNAKKHPDDQVEHIANSIREFGWQQPLVVDKNNVLVIGHGRLLAAKKLGLHEAPVVRADDLTEQQIAALRLADNKTNESAWDMDLLDLELDGIADLDMSLFGFEMEEDVDPADIVEDDVPDEVESRCMPGDVWRLGNHRLVCGDCTNPQTVDKLMAGALADLVVTDPPYNMAYEGAGNTRDRASKRIINDNLPQEQFDQFLLDAYTAYLNVMKDGASIYVFYKELGEGCFMRKMKEAGLTFKQELIWAKHQLVLGGAKYQNMYEPCLFGCKGKSVKVWNGGRKQKSVIEQIDFMGEDELREVIKELISDRDDVDLIREKKQAVNDLHPTMKPIRLLARLILNSSNVESLVLDFFGGSGSTMIACEQLNRRCYMSELDPHFCDVILQRWENFTGNKAEKIE